MVMLAWSWHQFNLLNTDKKCNHDLVFYIFVKAEKDNFLTFPTPSIFLWYYCWCQKHNASMAIAFALATIQSIKHENLSLT